MMWANFSNLKSQGQSSGKAVRVIYYGIPSLEQFWRLNWDSKEGDGRRATIEAIIVNHADFVNFEPFK